jgi:ABC-2 type transport system ATP-binding protein
MSVIQAVELVREFRVARKGVKRRFFRRPEEIKRAVDGVSFSVEPGELVGYIGPNGAGKSTTIKILAGILVPTSGTVSVLGNVPHERRKENAKRIGVVFGQRSQLWWDLPVADSFELLRRMYRVSPQAFERNMAVFNEVLGLGEFLHVPVRQVSLGQRMRADLAIALLHDPEVVFLDEPTIGLDVVAKGQLREFVRTMRRDRGITVLLTTHDMKDIEEICDRIVMIDQGKLVLDMPVAAVRGTLGASSRLVVDFEHEPEALEIQGVELLSREEHRWTLSFRPDQVPTGKLIAHVSSLGGVRDLSVKEPDIEDIVRDIYTGRIVLDGSGRRAPEGS